MALRILRQFVSVEAASGVFLIIFAFLSIILSNSAAASLHQYFVDASIVVINDGLMAIFFLLVGLELKRERLTGVLVDMKQVWLPAIAALGGVLLPALIYLSINRMHPENLGGWAIPVATDIAFALGILSLFSNRVPFGLKFFLMALAIFDDIAAILIVAFWYTEQLSSIYLLLSLGVVSMLYVCMKRSIMTVWPYLILGAMLWYCVLRAGIHPTIAGVLLALFIPHETANSDKKSLLVSMQKTLHPWVAFGVMPLFAFVNAGFVINLDRLQQLTSEPMSLGVMFGLLLGKPIGVLLFSYGVVRFGRMTLPSQVTWPMMFAVSLLCGVGFTMSLFIGMLSFGHLGAAWLELMRMAVFTGSCLSGVLAAFVLHLVLTPKHRLI